MNRWMGLLLAAAVGAAPAGHAAEAGKVSVGLWGGYGTASMKAVNDELAATGSGATVTKFSGGLLAGLEGLFGVSPEIGLGLRAGYVSAGTGKIDSSASSGAGLFAVSVESHDKITVSAIPVEVGGRYSMPAGDKLTVSGGLFLGLGLASAADEVDSSMTMLGVTSSSKGTANYAGSAFMGELQVGAMYAMSPQVGLGLDVGYRMLSVPQMKATADNADLGVKSGDIWKDKDNNDLVFDLSGITAELRVTMTF